MPHQCKNGHLHVIDFGDEVRVPCPTEGCGVMVSRTSNYVKDQAEPETVSTEAVSRSAIDHLLSHSKTIFAVVLIVVGIILFLKWFPSPAVKQSEGVTLPALDQPKNETVTPSINEAGEKKHNVISEVNIEHFQATVTQGLNTKITFDLVNQGTNNDYPSIAIAWRGVNGAPIEVLETGYPHPSTAFTRVPIEFEIIRPVNAKGVDVSVKYPSEEKK